MSLLNRLTPAQALTLSLLAAIITIALKTWAWLTTGSVGFLSDALESLVNLLAAAFALAMVLYARQPPDTGHPYGHGKAEYFSAAFEGALILAAALAIGVAAIERWLHPQALQSLSLGVLLSVLASLINLAVSRVLFVVGRTQRSVALEADARHLMTDVWTTAGVIVGVSLALFSGWLWVDPLVALLVAVHILKEGLHLLIKSARGLMDRALTRVEEQELRQHVAALLPPDCNYADLRTRRGGHNRFADLKLRVPGHWTITEAHALADRIEKSLAEQGYTVYTHLEPLAEGKTQGKPPN